MKKKLIVTLFLIAAMSLCACSQSVTGTQSQSQEDQIASQAAAENQPEQDDKPVVELTTEEAKDQVNLANSRATTIRNGLTMWVTKCDAMRVSPKSDAYTEISITVKKGNWKAEISNTEAFDQFGDKKVMATGAEEGTKAGKHVETDNQTEALEIQLANDNTDIDDAYIKAAMYNGKIGAVYFVDGTTSAIKELDDNIGDQAAWIDSSYPWSGEFTGTLADGTIVGTAPII